MSSADSWELESSDVLFTFQQLMLLAKTLAEAVSWNTPMCPLLMFWAFSQHGGHVPEASILIERAIALFLLGSISLGGHECSPRFKVREHRGHLPQEGLSITLHAA